MVAESCICTTRDKLQITERFESFARRSGPDSDVPGGAVLAEFFVARDVPVDQVTITDGRLKIAAANDLGAIEDALTPTARFAIVRLGLLPPETK